MNTKKSRLENVANSIAGLGLVCMVFSLIFIVLASPSLTNLADLMTFSTKAFKISVMITFVGLATPALFLLFETNAGDGAEEHF